MAESTTVTINDIDSFKLKALYWAGYFKAVALFDSNNYLVKLYPPKQWLLCVDALDEITATQNSFAALKEFHAKANALIAGYFTYDLKNEIEELQSSHPDNIGFPALYFFKPRYVFEINGNKLTVNRNYPETFELVETIEKINLEKLSATTTAPVEIKARTTKEEYLQNVQYIQQQIEAGDFYELNYCTEFYAENAPINPVATFLKLNDKGKAPFSCFFKREDKFLLCASPERFLKKEGNQLISQPIKGTIKKGSTPEENKQWQEQLRNDIKERAENVMIVDLVRNDLGK
ncbi:MAG TPA: chorismate-binding protein, partial [Chitinophagales bacterium]|nr:chorismate-binding protein [Chitinophagales bacterium]